MRTLLFGATLVAAFLLPVAPAAAQCCGGAAQATDHSAHAAPATPAAGCCAGHEMAAPAQKMACCDHPMAAATPMPCCDHHAAAVPADDPAVAMAGLGLSGPRFVTVIEGEFGGGGKTAPTAVPIR